MYDLPPSGWLEIYVILETAAKDKCHSRNTRRRRSLASCVRLRLFGVRRGDSDRPPLSGPVKAIRSAGAEMAEDINGTVRITVPRDKLLTPSD
jgi:hypothetical protein